MVVMVGKEGQKIDKIVTDRIQLCRRRRHRLLLLLLLCLTTYIRPFRLKPISQAIICA